MAGYFGNHWVDRHLESELMRHLDSEEEQHECNVCGKPIEHEGICDSRDCFKVDNE